MSYHKIIIIGSGFGGLTTAIKLQKEGIHDFIILERRSFMGGTWKQNTYPGAAVDVQSPVYSLSFEPYSWNRMFAKGPELRAYTDHIITKYNLSAYTKTNTNVNRAEWNDETKEWTVKTNQKTYTSQFIINASGPQTTPFIPKYNGIQNFSGLTFHSSNWNSDYDYKAKKIAIIGTGPSAVQIIPELAKIVDQLYVFQRTPHWVMKRPDRIFSNFEKKILKNKIAQKVLRQCLYLGLEFRIVGFKYSPFLLEFFGGRKARKYLKKTIKDPQLREKITPDFKFGCKRVILSNTYLQSLSKNNVMLLDKNQAISSVSEKQIITQDGQKLDVDCIIYSTGFVATDGVIPYDVIGKKEQHLNEYWKDYPRAYLGSAMPNFPNLFLLLGPNTNIGNTSAIFMIESQLQYVIQAIKATLDNNHRTVEVKKEVEEIYTENIHKEMSKTVWLNGGCKSWYISKSGKNTALFPGFSITYKKWAKNFKREDHKYV